MPFIDSFDLRYNNHVRIAQPTTQAVMFCLMDISGSMDEQKKNIAKRFFTLLYLFLTRTYEHIDVVFIRHHTVAEEVDEENFFHSRETGGTVVSSALKLMRKVIDARYPQRHVEHLRGPGLRRRQLAGGFGALLRSCSTSRSWA